MNEQRTNNEFIQIGTLWAETSKNGNSYLSGRVGVPAYRDRGEVTVTEALALLHNNATNLQLYKNKTTEGKKQSFRLVVKVDPNESVNQSHDQDDVPFL